MSTYGFTFRKETIQKFIPSTKFASIATQDEIDAVACYPSFNKAFNRVRLVKVFRGKAAIKRFVDAGFNVIQESKQYYAVDDQSIGTIEEEVIGPMVIIDRVDEKYSDNNGAYQVAIGRDKNNNVMYVSNMYEQSAHFSVGPIPSELIENN